MTEKGRRRIAIGLLLVAAGGAASATSTLAEYVNVGPPRSYRLLHRTVVKLDAPAEVLRVFQARPVEPAWRPGNTPWIGEVELDPPDAEWLPAQDDGSHWRWERFDVEPGTYAFESRLEVTTAGRELNTRKLRLSWDEVAAAALDVPPSAQGQRLVVPERLREVARTIRSEHDDPLAAVIAITGWIRDHIEYSVEVGYSTDDIAAIDRERKGWCGHQYTVFRALCEELGIPVRVALGYYVRNAAGLWNGRQDWNRHTWAEIHLPHVGWVEVEPVEPKTPFAIPRLYVKNSPDLQSEVVWVRRDGNWAIHPVQRDTVRIDPAGGRARADPVMPWSVAP